MIALTPGILIAAAIISSPTLYAAFVAGTQDPSAALNKYLLVLAFTWVAVSVFYNVVWTTVASATPPVTEEPSEKVS